jgi:rare lipoprotein A
MAIGASGTMLRSFVALSSLLLALAGCSSSSPRGVYKLGDPYQIQGRWYYPEFDPAYDRVGVASWYGEPFHGRATANGERFDRGVVTAAHPTLPLPSLVRVVNLTNNRELVVRVNDRGPFVGDRLIDLSQEAARQLGFERQGLAPVRVQFVGLADADGEPPQPTTLRRPAPLPGRSPEPAPQLVAAAPARSHPGASPPEPAPQFVATGPAQRRPRALLANRPLEPALQLVAAAPVQCRAYFIQVGAFAEPVRARRMAAELHALQAMPVSLATPAQDHLARVWLGPIADPTAVEATLDRVKRSGFSEAFIVGPEKDLPTGCSDARPS